jgi:hypothetical protein
MKFTVWFTILFISCCTLACGQQAPEPASEQQIKDLRWNANIILTQQLPSSLPDSLEGVHFRKVLAFSLSEPGSDLLEVREIRKSVDKDVTFGGSRYLLPIQAIDVANIKIVNSPDGQHTSIVIPAKKGLTFTHALTGSNGSEIQLPALVVGWYDHVQDRTLSRALDAVKQYLVAVSKTR